MESKDPNLYVISLDAIDLNLLPSIYTQDDRVEPLWNSILDKSYNECYQFQINSSDGGKVKEPSKPELEKVICHICDIEVPKPFLIEHSESSRHKTNLKISEIAVNRMRKHLNSTNNKNSMDIDKMDTSMYFCANCATVMDRKDKQTHEKSLSHKNSVVFEKFFHDFLILYDSDENGNNEMEKGNENGENNCTDNASKGNDSCTNLCEEKDCKTKEKTGNNSCINEENGNDFNSVEDKGNSSGKREIFFYGSGCDFYNNKNNGNDSYNNKNENDSYTDKRNENDGNTSQNEGKSEMKTNISNPTSSLLLKKPFNTSKKDTLPKESTAKRVSANDYVCLLNRRKDGLMNFKLSADGDSIEIKTIDGSIVSVSEENFHGFNKVGKKHIQCLVCKVIFKGSAVEAHKMSEKHIQLMVSPLRDKHCARQIDERLSHCLICNAVIKESDYHALCDDDHTEYLKAALVSDKLTEDYEQYAAKCLTSNELDIGNSNKDSTENRREKVENDENVKENDDWIEVSKNNAKAKVKANTAETNIIPTKYFCVSCNHFVYYSLKHNETANHIWNLKSDYHYLMKLKEDEVHCQVCKAPVTDDPDELKVIKNHVHEEEHVEKYNQLLVDNEIERFKRHFYCRPCNRVILIKNELKHTSEKRHKRFFAVKCNSGVTQQHEVDKITEQADEFKTGTIEYQAEKMLLEDYVCNICNVKVPNYERNIQEHMNGKRHAANAEKKPQVTSDENEITDINYQMEPTKFPNALNCLMCKVYILHNESSVSEHLNHPLHKMNYNIFLKDNNMVLQENDCYCNTCKVFVGIKGEVLHAFGRRHIKKQKVELAKLIELKNAKDKDIRNLKPFASNNLQKQNIATSSESINEDEQNILTLTVSPNEDEQNIATLSVSTNEDKQKNVTSSVSTVQDEGNIAAPSVSTNDEYKQNMVTASMFINDEDEQNINTPIVSSDEDEQNIATPPVSSDEDEQNIATPSVSINEDEQNTATPFVSTNQYKQSHNEDNQNIAMPSMSVKEDKQKFATPFISVKDDGTNIAIACVSTSEDKQNIVTALMSNLHADTFPPFIFDENFPMLKDLYRHGTGPNVVSMIKDFKRLRTADPDIKNQIRDRHLNLVKNTSKEDEINITTPYVPTTKDEKNIVTSLMSNLYADTFPPFIFDENFPMLQDLYRDGTGPNVVSMIKDHKQLRNDPDTLKVISDCEPNVVKNINKEDETNIATPSVSINEDKQNIVTSLMSNLYADTFPPFIFDENFPMLKDLYRHGTGTNVLSMIKDHKRIRNDPDTLKVISDCEPNVVKNINKEDETNIASPSVSTNEDKQNIATPSVPTNEEKQNIVTPFVSVKEDVTIMPMTSVSTYEDKLNIATPSVSSNEEKQNIATPFVFVKEDVTIMPMTSVSTHEDKQNIATSPVSTNEEKQNIATPFVSVKEDETNIATTSVQMTNEDKGLCIDSCVSRVINDKHDRDPNVAKSINIPSVSNVKKVNNTSLQSKSDVFVLGKNPGLPLTMLELLEPTANSKEVICKICKVTVPYTKSNVSNHINGPKHKNEYQKSLKNTIKYPDTSIVRDNRPSIDLNAPKVMNNLNVTKNIDVPSVSNAKKEHGSSLTSNNDVLVLGKNPGLPATMLELLEPTANSKEVICKICKVTVPYTESNVSTHINGSKHKNEYQKSLKNTIKYPDTSMVRDNRPSIDLNAPKVINNSNLTKNINVPSVSNAKKEHGSSLTSNNDVLVLGENPGLPATMLELLEPTANSKEVICKICKVTVPYTESNVSTHINGSKHKNEYQKSLKNTIKYPDTSIVRDNRPSIDLNAPKVINNSNLTKNINVPSVSNVEKEHGKSLTSNNHVLVLGENPGLPVKMLELLEPTANSKEVICKICKVKVPYTKSNVSTHINGPKHKNEHQKSLKSNIKYPDASSVTKNRPCNDSNVTKNINIPSVSNVKKVNDSSLQSKSDVLILGENLGLPRTMLELLLLEPTANSKEVICKICKVKVPSNMLNVSSHINGSNHKNVLKKVLKAT